MNKEDKDIKQGNEHSDEIDVTTYKEALSLDLIKRKNEAETERNDFQNALNQVSLDYADGNHNASVLNEIQVLDSQTMKPKNVPIFPLLFIGIIFLTGVYCFFKKEVYKNTIFRTISSGWIIWFFCLFTYSKMYHERIDYGIWLTLPVISAVLIYFWIKKFIFKKAEALSSNKLLNQNHTDNDSRKQSDEIDIANTSSNSNNSQQKMQVQSQEQNVKQTNFIIRHWRGDYSLAVSYWIFGLLISSILVVIAKSINSYNTFEALTIVDYAALILLFTITVVVISLWQLRGVWMSASYHVHNGGKLLWANIVKAVVVLGLFQLISNFVLISIPVISQSSTIIAGNETIPNFEISLSKDRRELTLAGGMPFGTTDEINKYLIIAPTIQTIRLNSIGGRMQEAYKLYNLIKEKQLFTLTSKNCVSACAIAYLAGTKRYLGKNAQLGFHSASVGESFGHSIDSINEQTLIILNTHNVPNSFANKALQTPPNKMWYPSKEELLNANIINFIVNLK